MDKIKTNVLLIGKSGSGKSSLLNYLFERKVAETGVGGAVTPPGVYENEFKLNENIMLNICDTWGLEADKTEKWKSLIMDKVREHDKKEISDWFSTIFYCFNVNASLIEEFELKIIKMLCEEKNAVIPVLTHCKNQDDEVARSLMRRIKERTGIEEENIICVNSVEQTLLGGNKLCCFGKENIFEAVKKNAWENIWNKIPCVLKKDVKRWLDEWERREFEYIETEMKGVGKDKKEEKIANKISNDYHALQDQIVTEINKKIVDVNEYYQMLCHNFALEMGMMRKELVCFGMERHKKSYYREKANKMLKGINFSSANEGVLQNALIKIKEVSAGVKDRKNNLKKDLHDFTRNAYNEISGEIDRVTCNFEIKMKYGKWNEI